jgi:AraC family ethanolamine operon transcriptional activator
MRFLPGLARSRKFRDPHEAAAALPGISMEVALVDRPTAGSRLVELDLRHVLLLRCEAGGPLSATGVVDQNVVSFSLPPAGESFSWTVNGRATSRDEMTILGPGAVYTFFTPAAMSWIAMRIDEEFFRRRYHAAFGSRFEIADVQLLSCGPVEARRLRAEHARALTLLEDPAARCDPARLHQVEERIISALLQALGSRRGQAHSHALTTRLLELLKVEPDSPLDLGRLCAELGTSDRTLRRTFRRLLGVSPARYLRMRRLHQARDALRATASGTVTQIAVAVGFSDLGRFARDYRDLFGELPSATLKRARDTR